MAETAPRPLYLTIADRIREAIIEGDYAVGARLPSEAQLATEFGVARTSVREALRVLASRGLIGTTRGGAGGSVVLQADHHAVMRLLEEDMQHLLSTHGCSEQEMDEVRELIDVTAAWMAASRRTPQHLEEMAACLPAEVDGPPDQAQIDRNLRFHYLILQATGNRLLHLFGEPVSVLIHSFYLTESHPDSYYQQVYADHRRILDCIRNRDPEGARRAMSEHICSLRGGTGSSPLRGLEFG